MSSWFWPLSSFPPIANAILREESDQNPESKKSMIQWYWQTLEQGPFCMKVFWNQFNWTTWKRAISSEKSWSRSNRLCCKSGRQRIQIRNWENEPKRGEGIMCKNKSNVKRNKAYLKNTDFLFHYIDIRQKSVQVHEV